MNSLRDEDMRERLLRMMDTVRSNWVLSAFYSDNEVDIIVNALYNRWEEAGRKGMPLDYASTSELMILNKKASHYFSMNENTARALVLSRMQGVGTHSGKERSVFSKLFRRKD